VRKGGLFICITRWEFSSPGSNVLWRLVENLGGWGGRGEVNWDFKEISVLRKKTEEKKKKKEKVGVLKDGTSANPTFLNTTLEGCG